MAGRAGDREHVAQSGYGGGDHYLEERAVVDGNLVTAGAQSPVQFAAATLARLGLFDEHTREAYVGVFHRADPSAFPALMQATTGAA